MSKRTTQIFILLGTLLSIILIGFFYVIIYGYIYGPELDKTSKQWVDTIVPQIVSNWDADQMLANSSSQLLKVQSREEITKSFATLSTKLGKMQHYEESTGQAHINFTNFHKTITADYLAHVQFENASSTIYISGIMQNDTWKIVNFYISADN